MPSFISGGGRAYVDLAIVISPTTSWTSHASSSPCSTLSESSNSPIAISTTRKPRTPRKRRNQTYNEAAALLSTAYPKIFSIKHQPRKSSSRLASKQPHAFPFPYNDSSELLLPFQVIDNSCDFLLHHPPLLDKPPNFPIESPKAMANSCYEKPCHSPIDIDVDSKGSLNSVDICEDQFQEDFDAESIVIDEEIEEGIDSIMGKLSVTNESVHDSDTTCYGYPIGLGYGSELNFDSYGMRSIGGVSALRNVDYEGDWWRFPRIDVQEITPKLSKVATTEKKKKKNKVEKSVESKNSESAKEKSSTLSRLEKDANSVQKASSKEEQEQPTPKPTSGLLLKLNYDNVLNAWSDKGCPFPEEFLGSESAGNDVHARLAQIDLFSEGGGIREASVLRYKEKRRSRLFSKKIRYQVRKVNADRRPRMKGRFVKSPNSPDSEQG